MISVEFHSASFASKLCPVQNSHCNHDFIQCRIHRQKGVKEVELFSPAPHYSGMPKEIKDFFSKTESYADKRKAALERRKKLLDELKISDVEAITQSNSSD